MGAGADIRSDEEAWNRDAVESLIGQLSALRAGMVAFEAGLTPRLRSIEPSFAPSARNLAHYLALRRTDIRPLQERLAWVGVSSLGRAETHVLANLDKVLGILHSTHRPAMDAARRGRAGGLQPRPRAARAPRRRAARAAAGRARGADHGDAARPRPRRDFGLVRRLVAAGMDIARINCAHDDATAWEAMAEHVRRAGGTVGRPVKILMDLAGPKLRTGPIAAGPAVLKLRPARDAYGRVIAPARLALRAFAADDARRRRGAPAARARGLARTPARGAPRGLHGRARRRAQLPRCGGRRGGCARSKPRRPST